MKLNRGTATVTLLTILAAVFVGDWLLSPELGWYFTCVLLILVLVVIGLAVIGRVGGILIDEQNLYSLSRFQTALWTVIVLSGYAVLVIFRLKNGNTDSLNIGIDSTLWSLMGISTASLVGSPLIAAVKKQKDPTATETAKTARILAASSNGPSQSFFGPISPSNSKQIEQTMDQTKQGILYANASAADASVFDLFEGEEVGNAAYADLGKIQMFFFTIILGIVYSAALINTLRGAHATDQSMTLPCVTNGMLALLGISHAGFLVNKGVDHTKQQ